MCLYTYLESSRVSRQDQVWKRHRKGEMRKTSRSYPSALHLFLNQIVGLYVVKYSFLTRRPYVQQFHKNESLSQCLIAQKLINCEARPGTSSEDTIEGTFSQLVHSNNDGNKVFNTDRELSKRNLAI